MANFQSNDIQQILQRALANQQEGEFSEQQLTEMAAELGISPAALKTAQQEWQREKIKQERRQASLNMQRKAFNMHLISYILVNVFLILINLVTTPGHFWAIYPLLGWGLGLGFHAASVYWHRNP